MPLELPKFPTPNTTPLAISSDVADVVRQRQGLIAVALKSLSMALPGGLQPPSGITHHEAKTALQVIIDNAKDISKALGVPVVSAEDYDVLNGQLRRAHELIARLEHQVGSQFEPGQLKLAADSTYKLLKAWWMNEGMGYVTDVFISRNAHFEAELTLGGNGPLGDFGCFEPDSESEAQEIRDAWLARLEAQGLKLLRTHDGYIMLDVEESRHGLSRFIKRTFPSAAIRETHSQPIYHLTPEQVRAGYTPSTMKLASIKVLIREPSEVLALASRPYMTPELLKNVI